MPHGESKSILKTIARVPWAVCLLTVAALTVLLELTGVLGVGRLSTGNLLVLGLKLAGLSMVAGLVWAGISRLLLNLLLSHHQQSKNGSLIQSWLDITITLAATGVGAGLGHHLAAGALKRGLFITAGCAAGAMGGNLVGLGVSQLASKFTGHRLSKITGNGPVIGGIILYVAGAGAVMGFMHLSELSASWISPASAGALLLGGGIILLRVMGGDYLYREQRESLERTENDDSPGQTTRSSSIGATIWLRIRLTLTILLIIPALVSPIKGQSLLALEKSFSFWRFIAPAQSQALTHLGFSRVSSLNKRGTGGTQSEAPWTVPGLVKPGFSPAAGGVQTPDQEDTPRPKQPNLLILSLDAVRADRVGVYGYKRDTTPNMDLLSEESFLFKNTYTCGVRTHQSLPCFLIGQYPSSLEWIEPHWGNYIKSGHPTLATTLKKNGYQTIAVAYDNHWFAKNHAIREGFSVWDTSIKKATRDEPTADRVTDVITRELDRLDPSHPFFLWAHYIDGHHPWAVDKETTIFGKARPDIYDGVIRKLDREVGRVMEGLRSRGLHDNTIVVITSDHGEELKDHGNWYHGWYLYEESVRIPLLIRVPWLKPTHLTQPVSSVDLTPSLLNLLNIEEGWEHLEGWNFAPLMVGESLAPRHPVVMERWDSNKNMTGRKVAMVAGDDKIIVDLKSHTVEWFNLARDPKERQSLVGDITLEEGASKHRELQWLEDWITNRPLRKAK